MAIPPFHLQNPQFFDGEVISFDGPLRKGYSNTGCTPPGMNLTRFLGFLARSLLPGRDGTSNAVCWWSSMVTDHFRNLNWRHPNWRHLITIYKAYGRPLSGNIPTKYGLIWSSTSILGSWNSHSYGQVAWDSWDSWDTDRV